MGREGMLAAVAANPDDDVVRLIFTDWLDEFGDALDRDHAELIRAQIELEHLPLDDDRRAELGARVLELDRWATQTLMDRPPCVPYGLSRGFPEAIGYDWNDSRKGLLYPSDLDEMASAFLRFPIRRFRGDLVGRLARERAPLELLAEWPSLAKLTSLQVDCGFSIHEDRADFSPSLYALSRSPYVSALRHLQLGNWQVDADALVTVAESPNLPGLVELGVSPGSMPEVEIALVSLPDTPLAVRLERLSCPWIDLPSAAVRRWLDRAQLNRLSFGVPAADPDGVGPLLGCAALARLRQLAITGEEHGFGVDELPDDEDRRRVPHLAELLRSAELSGLETLSLRGVALGDAGLELLAAGPAGRNLVELDLSLCGLTDAGVKALRPMLTGRRLRRLDLSHNLLTDDAAAEIAGWPEFARLHSLEVGYFTHIGDEGRAALAASRYRHPWGRVT